MLLEKTAHYNDISPKLRKILEEKILSFGKVVRYKFDIARPNPDPQKHNGDTVYPAGYTLDPTTFTFTDKYEDREGVSKTKRIGLIDQVDEKGLPNRFRKIKVLDRDRGVLVLNLEDNPEHRDYAMMLELHPKLSNGEFSDKTKHQVVRRIDEQAYATDQRQARSERKLAMDTAEKMSDKEIIEFADAMMWDSTQDVGVLRNMAEDVAEHTPKMFTDLVNDKKMKFQAAVKRGIDNKVFEYNPEDCKLTWASTGQIIVALGKGSLDNDYERLAEWFMTAGKKADEAYKKLLSLEKGGSVETV